jgi:ABC-2 type transport system ATP-binding protein
MALVEAVSIEKRFGEAKVLDALSLTVDKGQIYGLIGPDGAGKTTFLRILAGVYPPDGGKVSIAGLEPFKDGDKFREKLGYISQSFSLYGDLTVEENLDFFASVFGISGPELSRRKGAVLEFADLLKFRDRLAADLSGGMKQRLSLAAALIHEPEVLLLDEPTNGVDPVARRSLWGVVRNLASKGTGAVISTQYLEEGELCDKVGLLFGGRLLAQGTPRSLRAMLPYDVWEVELMGQKRSELQKSLMSIPVVRATRRHGSSVRVFTEKSCGFGEYLAAAGIGSRASAIVPGLEDIFTWLLEKGGVNHVAGR